MTRFHPTARAQAVAALLHEDLARLAARVDRLKARDLGPAQVEWLHRQFESQLRSLCDIRRAAREKAADLPRHKRRVALLDLDARGQHVEPCPACEGVSRGPDWACESCGHRGLERPERTEQRLEGA